MTDTKTLILNSKIVDQKINRITYQILEEFHLEKKIIFAGISKKGTKTVDTYTLNGFTAAYNIFTEDC